MQLWHLASLWLALSAIAVAPAGAMAQTQVQDQMGIASLNDAITYALRESPRMKAAQAGLDRAQAGVSGARAAARGAVRVQGQAATGSYDYGQGEQDIAPYSLSLGYERNIWDGRATAAAIAGAQAGQEGGVAQLSLARAQVRFEVARAWIEIGLAQKSLVLAQDHLDAVTRFERDASLQFQAGEVPKSVQSQASARRAGGEADLQSAKSAHVIAQSELVRVLGQNVPDAPWPVTFPSIPATLEDARPMLRQNSALLAAQAGLRAAKTQVAQTNGRSGGSVLGGVRGVQVRDEFIPNYRLDAVEAYVRFQQPLWDGGAKRASVAGARAGASDAQAQLDGVWRTLEQSLAQAYAHRANATAQIKARTEMVRAARDALTSIEAEFRVGQRPLVDVLDARRDVTAAQTALTQAQGAFILSHWEIEAALGQGG